jgi:hypothetical protein
VNGQIKRIQRVAGRPANPVQQLPSTNLGKRKAGDLSVGFVFFLLFLLHSNIRRSFGEHERTFDQFAYTWSVKPYEKDGPSTGRIPKTYVSFVFRYRTREWLQMQGIMPECDIPASPSPPVTRAPMRRVSSAPAVPAPVAQETTLITPRASPTPPRKKLKMEKPYLSAVRIVSPNPRREAHHFSRARDGHGALPQTCEGQ